MIWTSSKFECYFEILNSDWIIRMSDDFFSTFFFYYILLNLNPALSNVWYLKDIPDSPYRLEELVDCIEDVQSVGVKLNLLTAMFKLFLKRPPECQKALGKLIKYCIGMYFKPHSMAYHITCTVSCSTTMEIKFKTFCTLRTPQVM